MKELNVKKIDIDVTSSAAELPHLLDEEGVTFQPLNTINWEAYPYSPEVAFRIAYTDHAVLLHYKVKEKSVRGKYTKPNGQVWTDSCVEFFVSPGQDGTYYNIECNCIGTILLGTGKDGVKSHAGAETIATIDRWTSLGSDPFAERLEETAWEAALVIPFTAFFNHHIDSLEGKNIRANFYKCGDELSTPHFVSWNPIETEHPNFHVPEFFGTLFFE